LIVQSNDVPQPIRDGLSLIEVRELHLEPGEDRSEEIDKVLAMRHLSGPREWTPIARASAIYNRYMGQHDKLVGGQFSMLSKHVLETTALITGIALDKLKTQLYVFSIYKQASEEGAAVQPQHFSLLELLVGRPKMASEYFEFNREQLRVFSDGISKIDDFFLAEQRLINNPGEFRKLYRAFTGGGCEALERIRDRVLTLDQVLARHKDSKRDTQFKTTLESIREQLSSLPVSSFHATDSEALAIVSVKRLIDKTFWPLAQEQLGLNDNDDET
jgi:hypothetical protein